MFVVRLIRMILSLVLTIITWPLALLAILCVFWMAETAGSSEFPLGSPVEFYAWWKEWFNSVGKFFTSELS